jgi:hypothetical protein
VARRAVAERRVSMGWDPLREGFSCGRFRIILCRAPEGGNSL